MYNKVNFSHRAKVCTICRWKLNIISRNIFLKKKFSDCVLYVSASYTSEFRVIKYSELKYWNDLKTFPEFSWIFLSMNMDGRVGPIVLNGHIFLIQSTTWDFIAFNHQFCKIELMKYMTTKYSFEIKHPEVGQNIRIWEV